MSRMAFGQPVTAAPTTDRPDTGKPETDKWALLATLTEAAEDWGLNHRSLGVLRALLSFFPDRALPRAPGAAVVFPSNATLSQRLNGMPESTLRRHLAALVKAGIVSRQDSPNRKRFARRGGLAFGFDLSPLARAAEPLRSAAERARDRRAEIAALRDRLAHVRARLVEAEGQPGDDATLETARLTLRRKASAAELQALLDRLEPRLGKPVQDTPCPAKMSAGDSENERHIQGTNKKILVSKAPATRATEAPELVDVLAQCTEYKSYFPDGVRDWHGLVAMTETLHGMLGIAPGIYQKALRVLGIKATATVVLCMLEKASQIRNPGGYLRALIDRAGRGELNLHGMLASCGGPRIVS